uniref:Uncharacterized protein n=1 Tax=viral metagenome TaxID=1070528 RepID=A0A6C0JMV1_9ZZZZ
MGFLEPVLHKLDMDACSPEKIKKKFIRGLYSDYYLLQYEKLGLCFNDYKNMLYRSAIFSYPEKEVLSFTPMKSVSLSVFMEENPVLSEHIWVNEYAEGIMIQLFYDNRVNKWIMGTKGGVGGNYGYGHGFNGSNVSKGSNDTFYDMFLDALHANRDETLNQLLLLELLPKDFSYTFILQNPNITNVTNVHHLYLVSVYHIDSLKNQVEFVPQVFYEKWPVFANISGIIEFPKSHHFSNYNDLKESMHGQGLESLIITNMRNGHHCRIKSESYELERKSKLIPALTQYQYLCMRRIDKVNDFLKYIPGKKKAFYTVQADFENLISEVHQYYCDHYIFKRANQYSKDKSKYFTHIYKIHHTIYLPSLKNERNRVDAIQRKRKIYKKTVRHYFESMEPRELLFILNLE